MDPITADGMVAFPRTCCSAAFHGPLRRRLDPQGLAPAPPDPRRARARPTPPSPRPDAGSASRRCGSCSSRPPAPWPPTRPSGAFYRGWRLMGLDGTTLDLPDTPDNARTFGRPTHRPGRGGLPPGPAAGPLRAGHARRLRPGDQAAVPRRAVDGRPAPRPPRARACS